MPPNGEWESLQQKKKTEVWGQFRGAGWFPPEFSVEGMVKAKGESWKKESGEQKFSLRKGVFWFIGYFTVQAARLYERGNRNDHQIKEGTGIWKLHCYCS